MREQARKTAGEALRKFCVELVVLALKTSLGTVVALTTALTGISYAASDKAIAVWDVPASVSDGFSVIVGTMAILHDAAAKYLTSP